MVSREVPFLFKGPMALKLLRGQKWETRRLPDEQPPTGAVVQTFSNDGVFRWSTGSTCGHIVPRAHRHDTIWVKETFFQYGHYVKDGLTETGRQRWRFRSVASGHGNDVSYAADQWRPVDRPELDQIGYHKRTSLFMPRKFSRILMPCVGVRMERLQELDELGAVAEGTASVAEYRTLWDAINGSGSWDSNPWIIVYTFAKKL